MRLTQGNIYKKYSISFGVIGMLFIAYLIYPYFIKVSIQAIPESLLILDAYDNEIGEVVHNGVYRHRYKTFEHIPEFLVQVVIMTEDRRFFEHNGVDYRGIIRAFINNIRGGETQGASTLHSQLIRNNYWLNERRSYGRKIQEFLLARSLNTTYSKEEIIEMYMNYIHFGYLNYGFESASRYYYSKELKQLTQAEMIGLVTLIKNPSLYNPYTQPDNFKKRFQRIVESLHQNGDISEMQKIIIQEESLSFIKKRNTPLPYVRDFIKLNAKQDYGVIRTTFDIQLTEQIEQIGSSVIQLYGGKNVGDYSVIVIDKNTHELKVMIGGNDYDGEEGQVNGSLALRQPGSTLKPFIYALAFRDIGYHPGSTILDLPINFSTSEGNIYSPKNYTLDYKGEISLAEALAQSINIPAVKLLQEVGLESFMDLLAASGISSLDKSPTHYGLSLGLGSGEVSLYELTQAYSLFAYSGKFCPTIYIGGADSKCESVFEEKYIEMVQSILSDRYIKLAGFHLHSHLDFPDRNVFVKTGTSRNFRDNWSVGYTNNYIIGVWVGNKDASEMQGVSGVDGAGNIFHRIVYLLEDSPGDSRSQDFHRETRDFVYITFPTHNSIYQFDPTIPLSHQRIKLEYQTNISYDSAIWKLNGKRIEDTDIPITHLEAYNTFEVQLYKNNRVILEDNSVIRYIGQ